MIIFSDFDGTLYFYNNEQKFAEDLLAVQKLRQKGHKFCLATGRNLSSLQRAWKDYSKYLDAIILDNGAICLSQTGQLLLQFSIPSVIAQKITQDTLSYFQHVSPVAYNYDLTETPNVSQDATKVRFWVLDNATADEITTFINQNYGNLVQAYAFHDSSPTRNLDFIDARCRAFVDLASIDAGKDSAIAKASAILAPEEHIITIGDGTNDLAMIQRFDGYVITSGNPLVLAAVAPDHQIESVAALIHNILA